MGGLACRPQNAASFFASSTIFGSQMAASGHAAQPPEARAPARGQHQQQAGRAGAPPHQLTLKASTHAPRPEPRDCCLRLIIKVLAETASGPRSANTSQTIFELLGGARMSSSYLAYSLSHVSCPYASSVVAVPALIVGGARIKVKKFQSTSKMNEQSEQVTNRQA